MHNAVLPNHIGQAADAFFLLTGAIGRVYNRRIEYLAGAINHSHFTAVAITGVKPHGNLAFHRRLHEQRLEVERKHMDCPFISLFGQVIAQFTLHRGLNQPIIRVICGIPDESHRGASRHTGTAHGDMGFLGIKVNAYLEDALSFATIDRKRLVALHPIQGAFEVIIEAVNGILRLLVGSLGDQHCAAQIQAAQDFTQGCIVGNQFRDNIIRAL